jgi:hypothetical protein
MTARIDPPCDVAQLADHRLPTLGEQPCSNPTRSRAVRTEAPAVAAVGHLPRTLYTINSNRSRYQIISDYAARHDLSVKQVDELVRALPNYGVKSMLAGSVATLRRQSATIISLAHARSARAGRR